MSKIDNDDVPVTGPFLSLVKALHSARTLFICESAMAEELVLPRPADWLARCKDLFHTHYEKQVAAIGLASNQATFEALMSLKVPDKAWRTDFAELPKKFVFNPYLGQGYGGIKIVE
ncbi:hypothetical protein [Azonexus hydrophilus]|uniref:Uncharacterized protein n=1 Tax=Azonexus hydrophilus TaxID=418702 RepID=A0ABZ2XL49_9RHOO